MWTVLSFRILSLSQSQLEGSKIDCDYYKCGNYSMKMGNCWHSMPLYQNIVQYFTRNVDEEQIGMDGKTNRRENVITFLNAFHIWLHFSNLLLMMQLLSGICGISFHIFKELQYFEEKHWILDGIFAICSKAMKRSVSIHLLKLYKSWSFISPMRHGTFSKIKRISASARHEYER